MGCAYGNSLQVYQGGYGRDTEETSSYYNGEDADLFYAQDELKFPDFKELKNGKMIGEGYKKIPSYKCTIPYDELNQKRESFWKSRKKNQALWKVLRDCCESDNDTIELLLDAAMMSCEGENLRKVVFDPIPDMVFRIPNYCICDPIIERDYDEIKKNCTNIKEKNINVEIVYCEKNENYNFDVSNEMKVSDLKEKFAESVNLDSEKFKIRFLYMGFELMDDNLLCYDNVDNGSKILASVNEIPLII